MTASGPTAGVTREDVRRVLREARDIARRDAGPHGELDRALQVSWLLCLKVLDALQQLGEAQGADSGVGIEFPYRWRDWAARSDGRTGAELLSFVESTYLHQSNQVPGLLPYLHNYSTGSGRVLDSTIRVIFSCADNLLFSGQILREVVDCIEQVELGNVTQLWAAADAYDEMLREAYYAVDSQGGFFTPRPLVRFITQRLSPQLGERILDPACGTAGFLTEALRLMCNSAEISLSRSRNEIRHASRFLHGTEVARQPYLLGSINLVLHGALDARLNRDDSLADSICDGEAPLLQKEDAYEVIVSDPPLPSAKSPVSRTERQMPSISWRFLETIMRRLRPSGRAAMTIPLWVFQRPEDSAGTWRKFIHECDLHTVVVLDEGVYQPYSAEAACVFFFTRAGPTQETWIYRLHSQHGWPRFTKTRPIEDSDFTKCSEWWMQRSETHEATRLPVEDLSLLAREIRG